MTRAELDKLEELAGDAAELNWQLARLGYEAEADMAEALEKRLDVLHKEATKELEAQEAFERKRPDLARQDERMFGSGRFVPLVPGHGGR